MNEPLRVRHTTTYHPKPLACLENLPGPGAEFTPAQLRELVAALLCAADDCEALFEQARRYGPVRREYAAPAQPANPFGFRPDATPIVKPV